MKSAAILLLRQVIPTHDGLLVLRQTEESTPCYTFTPCLGTFIFLALMLKLGTANSMSYQNGISG